MRPLSLDTVTVLCGALGGVGANIEFMQFERSRELLDGRVESKCDGIGVLVAV